MNGKRGTQLARSRGVRSVTLLLALLAGQITGNCGTNAAETKYAKVVGMITDASGKVCVVRSPDVSRPIPVRLMMLIFQGDRITVNKGAATTLVFFNDGHRERLGSGTVAILLPTTCKIERGSRNILRPLGTRTCIEAAKKANSGQTQRTGGLTIRGSGTMEWIEIKSLSETKVTTDRPCFRWCRVGSARLYDVVLRDQSDTVMWQSTTTDSELSYPPNEAPLQPGDYTWVVTALREGEKLARNEATFQVVKPEDIPGLKEVQKACKAAAQQDGKDLTPVLTLALFYEANKLYDDAILTYEEIEQQRPTDVAVHYRLARLYERVGRMNDSKHEEKFCAKLKVEEEHQK